MVEKADVEGGGGWIGGFGVVEEFLWVLIERGGRFVAVTETAAGNAVVKHEGPVVTRAGLVEGICVVAVGGRVKSIVGLNGEQLKGECRTGVGELREEVTGASGGEICQRKETQERLVRGKGKI